MQHTVSRLCLFSAGVVLAASTSLAAEDVEFPERRAGQWEITMTPDVPAGMPAMTMKACVGTGGDQEMMRAALSTPASTCSRKNIRRDGDAIVIDSTCTIGPTTATSRVVTTGDFQSAYTVKATTEMSDTPGGMPGSTSMTQEARWVGADCADGMVPGDMLMPGGIKVNIKEMMKETGGITPPG